MTAATTQPIMPDEITVSLEAGPDPGRSFRSGDWPVIYDGNEYWINAEVSTALPYNDQVRMVAEAAARQIRVAKEIIREVGPPRPVITSLPTATGAVNQPFSYDIVAINNPTSYGATNLPAGLTVNTTNGEIRGTPTTTGTTSASMSATNAVGTTTRPLQIIIALGLQPPVISSVTTRTAPVGVAFSYTIIASNSPTSFAATNLPSWASINTTNGEITGTPDVPITGHVIGLEAINSAGTGHANLTLTINPAVPVVTNPGAQNWQVGVAITNIPVSATNSPTSYAATNLPGGVTINTTTGLISGTPAAGTQGSRTVNLTAINAGGTSAAVGMSVTILPAIPVVAAGQTISGTIGSAVSQQIAASNTPTSYAIASGTLPAGLSMNTTGLVSGTPTPGTATPGSTTIGVTATNAGGTSPAVNVTVNLAAQPIPVVNSSTTPSGAELASYTYQITATNSPTSYGATNLPAYLSGPDAQGRITGTLPAAPATATFEVTATNSGGTSTPPTSVTLTVTAVTGWEVTNEVPGGTPINATSTGNALGAMPNWTGWQSAYAADMTDAILYAASVVTPADQTVKLYATFPPYTPGMEFEVPFDQFTNPTVTGDNIREWGFNSGLNRVYLNGGANSTGLAIRLRLVKT